MRNRLARPSTPKHPPVMPLLDEARKTPYLGDLAVHVALNRKLIRSDDCELMRAMRLAATMQDFVRRFLTPLWSMEQRADFLTHYNEAIRECVGRANCSCVSHAEQGIPCPHDLELAGI